MNKIYKIYSVMLRKMIFCFDGINNKFFTTRYYKYLKKEELYLREDLIISHPQLI